MAQNVIVRWVRAIFDRDSARKTEAELAASLASAGKVGAESFLTELRAAFAKRMADLKVQLSKGLLDAKQFRTQADAAAREFNAGVIAGMEKARAAGTLTNAEYLKLVRTLKTVGTEGQGAAGLLNSAFTKASLAIAGVFARGKLFKDFIAFLSDSVREALAGEASYERLDVALRPLGLSYRAVSGEVERYIANLVKTTRFSDTDAREALVNLVTITGDYDQSLKLLGLTAELASKRHQTMAEAAEAVGKASLGVARGLGDVGIRASETGDLIAKLTRNLGDQAEQEGKGSGRLESLNNLWKSFKQTVGQAILGSTGMTTATAELRDVIVSATTWVEAHKEGISSIATAFITLGRVLADTFGLAAKLFAFAAEGWGKLIDLIGVGHDRLEITQAQFDAELAKHGIIREKLNAEELKHWTAFFEALGIVVAKGQDAAAGAAGAGIIKRRKLTQEERATLAKITADGGDELVNLTAKQLAAVHEIRDAAARGEITLAEEQNAAINKIITSEASRAAEQVRAGQERQKALNEEIADLRRLSAARGQGVAAGDALDQKLKEEAEIREATLKVAPAQRAAIEQEIRARSALKQSIEAWKAAENVTQEIAGARALAAARNISTEAGLVEARELATEAVIRQAVKGLTDEQAKAIAELIRVRDQEKRSADVAGQATGLRESIADQNRLNTAKRLGIRAGQDAVRELQDEVEVRRAVSGLVGEERARIEALTRAEQASRRAGDQQDFLNQQREELRVTLARQQAEERGPDAVRALNRELAIQQAVLQSGAKVGSAYEKQVRDIAARNYDAANRVKSVWVDALHKIKEEAQGQGSLFHDLAQAWVEGGIGGIVTLAKAKIKENIASGIEELAKAFGSFDAGRDVRSEEETSEL